ncbi:MAG TPA: DUF1684 domain-containing protein [Acidimicrobiia bacterium]|nr:DUF1684 domain-containing protein [Acidimicrobiia bacterium]
MDTANYAQQRRAKDEFFKTSHHSPLDPAHQADFQGLDYFDPNPDLVFRLPIEPGDGTVVRVGTSDNQEREYKKAGRVGFEVNGESVELTLYDTGHSGYFLPFRDATSGDTTYGAGRYLDLEPNDEGTVTIDFNIAYNPSCVYSDEYSCPLPPVDNWLQVPIEAGEKIFRR